MPALGQTVVNPDKALAMKAMGASYADLGKMFGTTPSNVYQIVSRYYPDIDLEKFGEFHRSPETFLELELYRLVAEVTPALRIKMIERRGMTDFGILFDKIRLLRGQSTSISESVPSTVINILQARLSLQTGNNTPTTRDQVIDIVDDNKI